MLTEPFALRTSSSSHTHSNKHNFSLSWPNLFQQQKYFAAASVRRQREINVLYLFKGRKCVLCGGILLGEIKNLKLLKRAPRRRSGKYINMFFVHMENYAQKKKVERNSTKKKNNHPHGMTFHTLLKTHFDNGTRLCVCVHDDNDDDDDGGGHHHHGFFAAAAVLRNAGRRDAYNTHTLVVARARENKTI